MCPAFAQAWKVHVTCVPPFVQILTHDQHALHRVDMAVDADSLRRQFPQRRGDFVSPWPIDGAEGFVDDGFPGGTSFFCCSAHMIPRTGTD